MATSTTSYVPDDAGITVQSLDFLQSAAGRVLLAGARELAATSAEVSVAQVDRLRRQFAAAEVHAALTLARLQVRGGGAGGKFPELSFLWGVPEAVEQASHARVARWKAARFGAMVGMGGNAAGSCIVDFCAGIGGDALALAEVAPVTAIDLSAVRARCLEFNVEELRVRRRFGVRVMSGDLREFLPGLPRGGWFHIDPARRSGGRRSVRFADLIPGPEVLERIVSHFSGGGGEGTRAGDSFGGGGAIKLSPAVDFDSLPAGHVELISHEGVVVQAVLWTGVLAFAFRPGTRTATVLGEDGHFTFTAAPAVAAPAAPWPLTSTASAGGGPPAAPQGQFLYELDGAVTRAGLAAAFAAEHGLHALTVDGGYLGGGSPVVEHSALTAFGVLEVVAFSEERVAKALGAVPVSARRGAVEVKARGKLPGIETDRLQSVWATVSHSGGYTVLLFPFRDEVYAVIARRVL